MTSTAKPKKKKATKRAQKRPFVCSMCGDKFPTDAKLWAHQTTFGHGGQQ